MSAPKHTPGPLVVEPFGVIKGGPLLQYARGSARDQIAAVMGSPRITDEERQANARLLAAAYTSYDRHCGPRAVECAEADLLGEALDALRGLTGVDWAKTREARRAAALAVLAKAGVL